ncbi:patatin-like phospholipase family protein [Nitratifractor salsuginis]|uniref:Patatin n=1 Tax=Nitratifractor salsuginis (strain DSM 16511 / JCM 12458 / E9I37-1) TaxID=749222 RepID=E6X3C4_NITSE|nr:patatin-like phospholipase family protein [Nitratifractor salsuginis]ADV47337.1 Patatin [Nitratifractor salsuginis DSM 16511]
MKKTNGKKISLVLGSGGARGYAHIGVIEELERQGYEIVCISGASMGALIGGLHAAGKLQEYKKWVLGLDALDVMGLLDFSWDSRGMVRGDKVLRKLEKILGKARIEELPIDYTAVATDLRRNREVWFQEGDLLEAIRASIAIPSFFTPVEKDGMLLVDGGAVDPLPVAPTMASHSDLTIAVSLFGEGPAPRIDMPEEVRLKESKLDEIASEIIARTRRWFETRTSDEEKEEEKSYHLFDIIDKTIDSMQKTLLGYRLGGYPPDLMIEIPQEVCGALDFHKAWEVIETGRFYAQRALENIG